MSRKTYSGIFFWCITCIEIFCICILGYIISQKRNAQHVSVSPIAKKNIQFPTDTPLKYYYEQIPNTTVTEPADWLSMPATHTINSDGLNERYDYPVQKAPGTYRIVTIGDSFTEGMYVDTANNYSERLEDMLNTSLHCANIAHVEVINLGVEGFDMQYILERYKRKGIKYEPDMVILTTTGTDIIFSNEQQRSISREQLMKKPQNEIILEQSAAFWEFSHITSGSLVIFTVPYDKMIIQIESALKLVQTIRPKTFIIPLLSSFDSFPDKHPSVTGQLQLAGTLYAQLTLQHLIPCQ